MNPEKLYFEALSNEAQSKPKNKYTLITAQPVGHGGMTITHAHHVTLEDDQKAAQKWASDRGLSIWFVLKGHCEYSEGWQG